MRLEICHLLLMGLGLHLELLDGLHPRAAEFIGVTVEGCILASLAKLCVRY